MILPSFDKAVLNAGRTFLTTKNHISTVCFQFQVADSGMSSSFIRIHQIQRQTHLERSV